MKDSHSVQLECPNCGSSSFATNPDGSVMCNYCHAVYEPPGGQVLDQLFERVTTTRTDWLRQVREEASAIKAQDEAASQARLAEMWATDERRREAIAQARAERDRQQRVMWSVALVVIVIFVVLVIVAIVIGRVQVSP